MLTLEAGDYDDDSEHAAEGTEAHALTESLLNGNDISDYPNKEMIEHAHGFLELCKSLENRCGGFDEVFIEHRIKLNDRIYGKADFLALYAKRTRLVIIDLKYGQGVKVDAVENPQLACYALSARKELNLPDLESATVVIYQPRSWDGEGAITSWKLVKKTLDEWEKKLVTASDRAYDVISGKTPAEFSPGTWCRFCGGAPICKAVFKDVESTGLVTLTTPSKKGPVLPDIDRLSNEQLEHLALHSETIRSFFTKVDKYLLSKALKGVPLEHMKLVESRSNRKWKSDDIKSLAKDLKELGVADPYKPPQIKGLTEIEREIGKNKINHLVYKPPGKLKLVAATSNQPEVLIKDSVVDMLDDLA